MGGELEELSRDRGVGARGQMETGRIEGAKSAHDYGDRLSQRRIGIADDLYDMLSHTSDSAFFATAVIGGE